MYKCMYMYVQLQIHVPTVHSYKQYSNSAVFKSASVPLLNSHVSADSAQRGAAV